MEQRLESVGEGLWTASAPLKLMGAEIGTRMTVVALPEGGLALISPISIDDALATALAGPAILRRSAFSPRAARGRGARGRRAPGISARRRMRSGGACSSRS